MDILASDSEPGHSAKDARPDFLIDSERVGGYLLRRDPTASLFAQLKFMDSVEDWVLQRLEIESAESRDMVRANLARLSEIIHQFRQSIPADNFTFLQVLAWLNTSVVIYVLDYLTQHQHEFMSQLLGYCKENNELDINAELMLKRVRALYRARLLDRIYSPENVDYVMRVLLRDAQ